MCGQKCNTDPAAGPPMVRQNGYGLAILTRDMLAYYEREGANLQQIHKETGVPTGVIYARRARLRRRER